MKPIEELGIVVGIFAGIWTLAQAFGKSGGNTCGAPASAPSGTVQTTPFAGTAPTIPVPQLTNPFTTVFPTFHPLAQSSAPPSCATHYAGPYDFGAAPTCAAAPVAGKGCWFKQVGGTGNFLANYKNNLLYNLDTGKYVQGGLPS